MTQQSHFWRYRSKRIEIRVSKKVFDTQALSSMIHNNQKVEAT